MTMLIIYLIKNSFIYFKRLCGSLYRNAKLRQQNPTCLFDLTSQVIESDFEKYVVIFDNTKVYNCKIGAYSYIQMSGRIFHCEIGKFCSIAASVSIAPGMHDMNRVTTHPSFYFNTDALPKVFVKEDKLELYKRVYIGHDVWIGEKVVIIDGVKIGNGAVIASGAIVVKDVEPYSVVGGVPARHLKYRFDPETIALFEKSEWWNYPDEWFEKNAEIMLDVDRFKEYLKGL
ncbi:streptogramin A acetyltransferase [Flavobacterium succinicans]|uniref:Streptogramin A acetyltransferase n=1 Tax=Flavobacterium succinicans TaxID=29536 RepID=A0A199XPB4_9FLAO|nr:streptogramin A acetyltransferase [Flavobacterium succinicans]